MNSCTNAAWFSVCPVQGLTSDLGLCSNENTKGVEKMTKDINAMQPEELLKHIEEAQKILEMKKENELENLANEISTAVKKSSFSLEEVARKLGLKLADDIADADNTQKSNASYKYFNPAKQDEGWSGKGRPPEWLIHYLKEVRKVEYTDFSTKDPLIAPELAKLEKK